MPKRTLTASPKGIEKAKYALIRKNWTQQSLADDVQVALLGSLVGESEGNVRRALKTASAIAPCVLWVDEIESAAHH